METPAPRFVWVTHDGQELRPAQMRTTHLFYTLRMIFNHLAPPAFRIPGCKRWTGIDQWDRNYLAQAVRAMSAELLKRHQAEALPAWMEAQLRHMEQAAGQMLRAQLN